MLQAFFQACSFRHFQAKVPTRDQPTDVCSRNNNVISSFNELRYVVIDNAVIVVLVRIPPNRFMWKARKKNQENLKSLSSFKQASMTCISYTSPQSGELVS